MLAKLYINLQPDEQLIRACCKGKVKAQRELYDRFAPQMQRVALRYMRTEFDAEEAVVMGFTKVFTHLPKFEYRGPKSLEGWIKRIIVNEALMLLRKNSRFLAVDEEHADSPATATTPLAEASLEAESIHKLVADLPTGYRTVFNLYAIEGYSHKEIADQLNISENTSKSQLSKARKMLQRFLQENGISV